MRRSIRDPHVAPVDRWLRRWGASPDDPYVLTGQTALLTDRIIEQLPFRE